MLKTYIEGGCSYLTSFTAFFVSVNWNGVGSTFLMLGSIILLLMRLYVEYQGFRDKWKIKHNKE